MSTDTIKNYGNQDVLKVFCPFCIEAANVVKGGKVSKSCFQKYSIDQLVIHLNGKKHSREQEVAMRAADASYWDEFDKLISI